jgi:CubicO group peptidase (beta-lactamase class C family)
LSPAKGVWLLVVIAFALSSASLPEQPSAAESPKSEAPMAPRIEALIPELEDYVAKGMNAFDVPGLAIGIVTGDRLVYGKGFGVRRKGGAPVDTRTVFQIGSTTKAFLATTMAIMVDRGKLEWDDRIVDLDPTFQLKDPWVTREFRLFDVIAQRSGLPPYANDNVGILGADKAAMIRSLRYVEPVSSFRSTFAYCRKSWRRPGVARRRSEGDPRSSRHEGHLVHRGSHQRRGQSHRGLPLDPERNDRGALQSDLSLWLWRGGEHQLDH